jgi:hypothetical protein
VTAHEFDVCITDARSVAHFQTPMLLGATTASEDKKNKHYKDKLKGANAELTLFAMEAGGWFGKRYTRSHSRQIWSKDWV